MGGGQEPGARSGVLNLLAEGFPESQTWTVLAKSRSGGRTSEAAVRLAAVSLTARPLGSQARRAPWLPPPEGLAGCFMSCANGGLSRVP